MNDERPVEELIGWTRCHVNDGRWHSHPESNIDHDRAEVDDLADWLRRRDPPILPSIGVGLLKGWEVTLGSDFRYAGTFSGPTIRDALVAAVRKVAT